MYEEYFPFLRDLSKDEMTAVQNGMETKCFRAGELVNSAEEGCAGLMAVKRGQLRTYIVSDEGREITLFRVNEKEICVLSVSCLLDSIVFDVVIEAAEETAVYVIPVGILRGIEAKNANVGLFLYKSAAEKFSEVMWTMQQLLFMRLDQRIAIFLWDELGRRSSRELDITHEMIARQIGSAREVVTRIMKYFEAEGILALARGRITVTDKEGLKRAACP